MPQVEEHEPPPNPAKMTDPRAADYVAEHGEESWEVDALPPPVLTAIIRTAFRTVVDTRAMATMKRQEEDDKTRLRRALETLDEDA
jgi:hypothetical protein